jgi:hypothetical protein
MRTTMLAAIAAVGLGLTGSATFAAGPVYEPGSGTAAETAHVTHNVWYRYHYHYHWYPGGGWCWRHPYRC